MTSEGNQALLSGDSTVTVVLSNIVRLPGHDPVATALILAFPLKRGEFVWDNLLEVPRDSGTVWGSLLLGNRNYVSVEGTTTVIFAGDVSNYVSGVYKGTFATAFGDTVTIEEGRFDLPQEDN